MQIEERDAPTPYDQIGGDAKVRELVDRFYDLMDFEPAYRELRLVHGSTLQSARDKLYLFLSGWLGGPPLYMDKFGHPMLRAPTRARPPPTWPGERRLAPPTRRPACARPTGPVARRRRCEPRRAPIATWSHRPTARRC